MRIRLSIRSASVPVIAGVVVSVLVAGAALAKLALPRLGEDDRPQSDVGRPVAGVSGPVLVPIIEVQPSPSPAVGSGEKGKKERKKGKAKGGKAKDKAKGGKRTGDTVKDAAGKVKDKAKGATDTVKDAVDGLDVPNQPSP
jgi:hypothetical protein